MKLTNLIFILFLTSIFYSNVNASASSFTVNQPNSSTIWSKGSEVDIIWDSNVELSSISLFLSYGDNIKIDLYKGNTFITTVGSTRHKMGVYTGYVVPSTLISGNDYRLLFSISGDAKYYSDFFSIKTPQNPSSIFKIVSPTSTTKAHTELFAGSQSVRQLHISWEGYSTNKVVILLYKGGNFHSILAQGIVNENNFKLILPSSIPLGEDYQVLVVELNGSTYNADISDKFEIAPPIKINNPYSLLDVWGLGSTQYIYWEGGNPNNNVRIELWSLTDGLVSTIAGSTPNDGVFEYTLPTNLPFSSSYRINIYEHDCPLDVFVSVHFTIKNTPPFINITVPNSFTKWEKGKSYNIYWTDNIEEDVLMILYKKSNGLIEYTYQIQPTLSDGSYTFVVPQNAPIGNNYRLIIASVVNPSQIRDESEAFAITNSFADRLATKQQDDINVQPNISTYPNPVTENATVKINLNTSGNIDLQLFDITARKVKDIVIDEYREKGIHYYNINVDNLQTGMYILVMNVNGTKISHKINIIK